MATIATKNFNTIAPKLNQFLDSDFDIEQLFVNLIKSNETEFFVATEAQDLFGFDVEITNTYSKSLNTIFDTLRVFAETNRLTESYWQKTTVTVTSKTKREDGRPELTASYSFYNKANKANAFTVAMGSLFGYVRSDVNVYIDLNDNRINDLAQAMVAISYLDRDAKLLAERNHKVLTELFA